MSDTLETTLSAIQPTPTQARRRSPLAIRDFRLLWAGESISLLGDQFHFVTLP